MNAAAESLILDCWVVKMASLAKSMVVRFFTSIKAMVFPRLAMMSISPAPLPRMAEYLDLSIR